MDISDDELEPFQMTGDEFQPRRRKFTKEDRIYGMWAEHDSDEEQNRHGYTRPVNFVSSGQQGNGEGGSGDEDSDYGEKELDEEAKRILEGLDKRKLDKGGKKAGVGKFTYASLDKNKELGAFNAKAEKKGEKKGGGGGVAKAPPAKKGVAKPKKTKSRGPVQGLDKDFGRWERHTMGFGSKMLSKMGWTHGTGLGSEGAGIVNPVKAASHKEFGKGLAHMQVNKPSASLVDVSDSEEEQEEVQPQQWKKGKGAAKPKYIYKTVDELTESSDQYRGKSGSSKGAGSGVKVIDMTGPQKRVLSGYDEIHNRHAKPNEKSQEGVPKSKLFMPELLHNVQLLVDQTEQDIVQTDRKLRYNRDLVVNLSHEREERVVLKVQLDEQVDKLSEILASIDIFAQRTSSPECPLKLMECEDMMKELQDKYPVEYKIYGLSSVAVAIVFPLISKYLDGCGLSVSHGDANPMHVFATWKDLLREQVSDHTIPSSENMDPYDRLVWEVWMPKLRRLLSSWSPRTSDHVVDLLTGWRHLLPEWILQNLLDQLIMPKLQSELENWNPTTDVVPIHKWIHPWLPLMDKKLVSFYPSIRFKMASALNNWHPSDKSAHKILEPWVQVFSPQVMEAFVVRTILPKLSYCLQVELHINPQQQDIVPLEWVLGWRDMVGPHHYASVLEKSFFPKWIQVLSSWLSNNPNFEEVTKWYSGWKGMFDAEILREPAVKFYLNQALDMMNRAVGGTFQAGARENMAYFVSTEKRRQPASIQNAISAPASVSFKDVIERMAEENGILFMPVSGQKRHDGKLLYSFGQATLYIDRGVTFVTRAGQWSPVSLDELLRLA